MLLLIGTLWDFLVEAKDFGLGAGLVTIIVLILNWIKDKPKDKVTNERTEAETKRTEAEAYKLKAEADVTVADSALKLANRISADYLTLKEEHEKTKLELEQTKIAIKDLDLRVADCVNKYNGELQNAVLRKKEIEDLRDELIKLKHDD